MEDSNAMMVNAQNANRVCVVTMEIIRKTKIIVIVVTKKAVR